MNIQQQPISSNSKDLQNDNKCIELLFSKFAVWYGHIWRSQFKDEGFLKFAKKEWREALSQFTDAVIDETLKICRECYELPPTLPQVMSCCRQTRNQQSIKSTFCANEDKYIPAPREVVEFNLQECKKLLGVLKKQPGEITC